MSPGRSATTTIWAVVAAVVGCNSWTAGTSAGRFSKTSKMKLVPILLIIQLLLRVIFANATDQIPLSSQIGMPELWLEHQDRGGVLPESISYHYSRNESSRGRTQTED
jgi:hypothetical protein